MSCDRPSWCGAPNNATPRLLRVSEAERNALTSEEKRAWAPADIGAVVLKRTAKTYAPATVATFNDSTDATTICSLTLTKAQMEPNGTDIPYAGGRVLFRWSVDVDSGTVVVRFKIGGFVVARIDLSADAEGTFGVEWLGQAGSVQPVSYDSILAWQSQTDSWSSKSYTTDLTFLVEAEFSDASEDNEATGVVGFAAVTPWSGVT